MGALRHDVGVDTAVAAAVPSVQRAAEDQLMSETALTAESHVATVGDYTLWLKRRTPQNIVIGGLAGAMPPAIGWAAVTGSLSLAPVLLVAIIFLWTPPPFWALSLWRAGDYARAGVPMMPVVRGKRSTRRQILAYTILLVPCGLLPAAIGLAGPAYLATAGAIGIWFARQAIAAVHETNTNGEPAAHRLFRVSLIYMFALFAALIAERLFHVAPFAGWT